ncbi:aldehyde dehydrogenase family protein [Halovivax limisalsi]|uniref:aldehyde dehydrogenase family protein n=1 Tax=Halovivax limisalsi TaxID=1453760 RepID=UPI001FFD89A9|nr:aldehyde dehydrogenase family protein [Halovivax limisalsi]
MAFEIHDRYQLFVDGAFVDAADGETRETIDPATGEPIATVAEATATDVDRAVEAAAAAQPEWAATSAAERGRILQRVARSVREHADELAELESRDQGKPVSQAHHDVEGVARFFEYYGGAADKLEGRTAPTGADKLAFTEREPYGVSGQIVPWNFPVNLTARGVAPALAAGNAVVVKAAPTTPLSALRLAELASEAGVPDGALNVLTGGAEPGEALSDHGDVDVLTFTGSVPTGQAVMQSAAETITPVTLELGGKNAAIVTPEADLGSAVFWTSIGIFTNGGQICSAADRAVVHESIYDDFVESVVDRAESYDLGPGVEDPGMGPLNHESHYESVLEYIDVGVNEGATLATGGEAADREGFFVEPTVFTDVEPDMRIAQEEIFGPVLTVIPYGDPAEAVDIANGVEYGLTGGVFSQDVDEALSLARRVDAGTVYVNEWFGGTPETPFGGTKKSGIGREKGLEALDAYLQTKSITVNLDDPTA